LRAAAVPFSVVAQPKWLVSNPDAFVLPTWYARMIRRDRPDSLGARVLTALESGKLGYRPARRWESTYLQAPIDQALDPLLGTDLAQGELGFTVYVKER
jgi:hypothetical protein